MAVESGQIARGTVVHLMPYGALVRLVTPLRDGEELAQADALMAEFVGKIAVLLPRFIPD